MERFIACALALTPVLAGACTIVRIDSKGDPARIESRGLIDGHAAIGIPAESHLLHLDLFDGSSSGAIAELVVWKLFRLEVGLAGASVGVGPFSLGLGVLFYDAEVPEMERSRAAEAHAAREDDDGVIEED